MNLKEVKAMAQGLGIAPRKLRKGDLIRAIQKAEHNIPCFGASGAVCNQEDCLWRKDCLK